MIFVTSYAIGGHTYGEWIEASSWAEARQVALSRGMGEHVEGTLGRKPSKFAHNLAGLIAAERWMDAAHAATQLSFVGMSSGALTVRECMGDSGLVHELLHLAAGIAEDVPKERRALIARVRSMAREFEYRVPGWPASFTGQPGVTTPHPGQSDGRRPLI